MTAGHILLFIFAAAPSAEGLPTSPWLSFHGQPPKNGAIAVLVGHASTGNKYRIIWSAGGESTEREADLTATPDPWRLPTLGPLKWPAVFDVRGDRALVFGARGWGWIDLGGKTHRIAYREKELLQTVQEVEDDVSKKSVGKFTRHAPSLVVLPPQPLRREPKDDSALSNRAMPKSLKEGECTVGVEQRQREIGANHSLDGTPKVGDIPVRVVRRKGDWIEVVLPRAAAPIYRCGDGALVSWESVPAGWARVAAPGPVPGTRILLWHSESWGSWP